MKKIYVFILIIFFISVFRITYLIIYKKDYYNNILNNLNNNIIYGTSAPRGRILDRNGNIIVDNIGVKTIIYNNISGISEIEQIEISDKLGSILDINEGSIDNQKYYYYIKNKNILINRLDNKIKQKYNERKITTDEYINNIIDLINDNDLNTLTISDKKASYIFNIIRKGYNYQDKIIKKDCTDLEYNYVINNNIKGLRGELTFKRINNYGNTLENLIGDVGNIPKEEVNNYLKKGYELNDLVGTSYLEKYYEDYLKGTKAKYKINNDNTITKISDEIIGNDIVLNIDINLQQNIEKILESEILNSKKYKSTKYYNGSYIIISDPNTGGILAMVGKSYKDNKFYNNELGNIYKSYTVGSVVKGATMSLGYKYNVIDIGTSVYDSCVKLKNKTEKCSWKSLGYVDDLKALEKSSNYYQFLIAIGLTGEKYKYNMSLNNVHDAFIKYRETLKEYGLGTLTGIDLENETTGIIGKLETDDLLLNLSIGQYDTYTPIELTQYINTISQKGIRYKTSIMKEIISPDGKIIKSMDKIILNKVNLDEKYLKRIRDGLRNVSLYGTGYSYINKEYEASSKTGTSETMIDTNNDNIVDTSTTTRSFISYMPSDNPMYSMVIISPNIDYTVSDNDSTYPINIYLSKKISELLFE